MSEKSIIENTEKPITVSTLVNDFIGLGIQKGDILLIHTSLSSVGWVCGGPQALIMALLQVVGTEGTIVMPAHSGDWSNPENWSNPPVPKEWISVIHENMPAFDKNITPTRGLGRTAELFRTLHGTVRSDHPTVSFAAKGRQAEEITKTHKLDCQFGIDSPLGKLYALGAKVLMIGTDYNTCTSFHLSEVLTEKMEKEKSGTSILVNGLRKWVWYEDFKYSSDDFPKIGEEFEKSYEVLKGKSGIADCTLFDMKNGVDFATEWLNNYRFSGSKNRIKS